MQLPTKPHARVIWLTGLSGAGKSTLAALVAEHLRAEGYVCELLDGDEVRRTTSRDLGFSDADRAENIRRLGELARQAVGRADFVLVAAISPVRTARDKVRSQFRAGQFLEVFVDAPLAVCERRDPKGLYRKVRQGAISQFTGIDSAYERPTQPEIHLSTDRLDPAQCAREILLFLRDRRPAADRENATR